MRRGIRRDKPGLKPADLDHYGHEHGIRLARDLDTQLSPIVERISELKDAGWQRIRIVTDHGWLLIQGFAQSELPKHQTETRWGRCAVLKDSAYGTPLTFGWDWCKAVQVAYAPGVTNFIAGAEYAHGGSACSTWCPSCSWTVPEPSEPLRRLNSIGDLEGTRAASSQSRAPLPASASNIRTKAALATTSIYRPALSLWRVAQPALP